MIVASNGWDALIIFMLLTFGFFYLILFFAIYSVAKMLPTLIETWKGNVERSPE